MNNKSSDDPRGVVYIGSASCKQCHQSIYDAYSATSHFNSTQTSSTKNILGSFVAGHNTFIINAEKKIAMEQRDSGLFQVLYVNGKEQEIHGMDITFGVKHAQTFLYWQGNQTYELPISYYTSAQTWASSPAYPSVVNFTRLIGKGCFECHSSYIESKLVPKNQGIEEVLDKKTLINGIDCERCHGPATNHVNYHLAYSDLKEAKYMVTSQSLSRQQKLDACAVCHSGNDKQKVVSTFKFKGVIHLPISFYRGQHKKIKQLTLMYTATNTSYFLRVSVFCTVKLWECSTCHNPHTNAGKDLNKYSKKCLSCHANADHSSLKMSETMAYTIKSNCIDCHMPEQPSRAITFQLAENNVTSAYLLRTHKIGIYSRDNTQIDDLVSFIKHHNKR